ncbi:MAG: 30S ribosomal protein S20 [Adlercreutzia equolifaciens]
MANIKSQKKRIITNEKRRMRNRAVKSELKTAVRHVKDAVAEGNGKDAYAFACEACRLMDKAASRASSTRTRPPTARAASCAWPTPW